MADPRNALDGERLHDAAGSASREDGPAQENPGRSQDSANREDWAALAAHLADKAAGVPGIRLEDLDAALDRVAAG